MAGMGRDRGHDASVHNGQTIAVLPDGGQRRHFCQASKGDVSGFLRCEELVREKVDEGSLK